MRERDAKDGNEWEERCDRVEEVLSTQCGHTADDGEGLQNDGGFAADSQIERENCLRAGAKQNMRAVHAYQRCIEEAMVTSIHNTYREQMRKRKGDRSRLCGLTCSKGLAQYKQSRC